MARKKIVEKEKHRFEEDVENALNKHIIDGEFGTAIRGRDQEITEFESIIQMLECVRAEKDYEWLSDYFIPELPAKLLTDASNWASQYFQTREFVKVKLDGNNAGDDYKCKAAEQCLNQALNNPDVHHYQKYIRGRMINSIASEVLLVGWWEQETKDIKVGTRYDKEVLDVDEMGNQLTEENQVPAVRYVNPQPIMDEDIIKDQFNYDVLPPTRYFTDRTYCYTIQEKPWVILWFENAYEDLKKDEDKYDYFNLDLVKEMVKNQGKTELSKSTYAKDVDDTEPLKPMVKKFDRLMRFGKAWAIIKEKDNDGNPSKIEPGLDRNGEPVEKAELVDAIVENVFSGNKQVLISFRPNPNRTSRGRSYYPLARGLCYIHPTKDSGLSDGKYLRELQIGINDHFNMGSDRVKLATLPTLKVRKYALEGNTSIYIEPGHNMELEDPDRDIKELEIKDNINGTIAINQMLMGSGDKVTSIFPTTMGELPGKASTTATAVAGSEQKANIRANYKSLTYEHTFLIEMYWLILQMTWQYARPKTAVKMMGEYAQFFDPEAAYTYSPLTANIETEYNRYRKLQIIDQFIGRLVNVQNPQIVGVLNYLLSLAFELFGKELPEYKKYLLTENNQPAQPTGGGGNQIPNMQMTPMSNQNQIPMSGMEQETRQPWNYLK